jgi:hypothetical protein
MFVASLLHPSADRPSSWKKILESPPSRERFGFIEIYRTYFIPFYNLNVAAVSLFVNTRSSPATGILGYPQTVSIIFLQPICQHVSDEAAAAGEDGSDYELELACFKEWHLQLFQEGSFKFYDIK